MITSTVLPVELRLEVKSKAERRFLKALLLLRELKPRIRRWS
jgi:hypothetical protein